jgi:hypothetical protein
VGEGEAAGVVAAGDSPGEGDTAGDSPGVGD